MLPTRLGREQIICCTDHCQVVPSDVRGSPAAEGCPSGRGRMPNRRYCRCCTVPPLLHSCPLSLFVHLLPHPLLCCVAGPGISDASHDSLTPFQLGTWGGAVSFDEDHCIQVRLPTTPACMRGRFDQSTRPAERSLAPCSELCCEYGPRRSSLSIPLPKLN